MFFLSIWVLKKKKEKRVVILIRFHQTDFAHICHFLLLPSNII